MGHSAGNFEDKNCDKLYIALVLNLCVNVKIFELQFCSSFLATASQRSAVWYPGADWEAQECWVCDLSDKLLFDWAFVVEYPSCKEMAADSGEET